jgi:tetratricopeptide (TPR) repeat protein
MLADRSQVIGGDADTTRVKSVRPKPDAPRPFPLGAAPFPEVIARAARSLEARLERSPGYPDLWNRMGLFRAAQGKLDEAGTCFERALAANPRFLGAVENRAWTALASGDAYAWERFFEGPGYVRLHPGVRHHLLLFATARFESPERALVMSNMPPQGRYENAHKLDRLWLLLALGRVDEVRILVQDMTCSDPALRGAFAAAGGADEGFEAWRAAYAFNPQLADICVYAALDCQREGETKESRALVDWALALSLDLSSFWVNLGLHHESVGETSRTLPCLERAVAANPQNRRARKEYALALVARGRNRDAIAQFETLRETAPNYADVRFQLGLLYLERGDLDAAGEEFSAALGANPRYTRAALQLARVRRDQGRWVEARAGYERVVTDGVDDCEIRLALAEVYEHLGEEKEAELAFARAAEIAPDDANLLRARADWYERHGKKKESAADHARLDALLRDHPMDEAA